MNVLIVFDGQGGDPGEICAGVGPGDRAILFPLTSTSGEVSRCDGAARAAGADVEVVDSAGRVNASADAVRDRYLRFVSELPGKVSRGGKGLRELFAVDRQATLWWYSLVAEKNVFKTDSFNRLCQLDAAAGAAEEFGAGRMVVSVGSAKLRHALAGYASRRGIPCRCVAGGGARRRLPGLPECLLALAAHAAYTFARSIVFRAFLRGRRRHPLSGHDIAVVSYFPNFDPAAASGGTFRNSYYPYLQEAIEGRGQTILWILMHVPNPSVPLAASLAAARRFLRAGHRLAFLEEFRSLGNQARALADVASSAVRFLRLEREIRGAHRFGEYEFYDLFREDWLLSFAGPVGYAGALAYRSWKTLIGRTGGGKCLYEFEMHAWENALADANRSLGGPLTLFAYQCGTVSRMLLNYWHHPTEVDPAGPYPIPRPDLFICNGPQPVDAMLESGWPRGMVRMGEAIRYLHLREHLGKAHAKRNVAFVALSISPDESCGILNMAYDALRDLPDLEVWVKPHPFLDIGKVFDRLGWGRERARFVQKTDPIREILPSVKLVIVGESGVSLKAVAFGCHVVSLEFPEFINMSPLRGARSDLVRFARSREGLRSAVLEILSSDAPAESVRDRAAELLGRYFCLDGETDVPIRLLGALDGAEAHQLGKSAGGAK